ncbi:MAG: AAA family ATPase [Acidimicrobiales bacterium]
MTTSAGRDPLLAGSGTPPGRGPQLERFVELAASLASDGPAFHLLEAGAGLGKTRLLEAAVDRLAGAGHQCIRVPSEQGQEPYRSAVRLLGELGVPADDLLDGRRAIENLLADRAQADLDGVLGRLARAALDAAQSRPTILLLDDFHWIDPASAALVDALVKELAGTVPPPPVLLALAYRPITPDTPAAGLVARLAGERRCVAEVLEPLDGAALFEAVEQLVPATPSPTYQAMVQRASNGNPLRIRAAVEILRRRGVPPGIGADDRRAQGTIDTWFPSADPVVSWIDGLAETAQHLLGAAAILATEFTAVEAAAISGTSGREVDQALDAAHAAGLVATDGTLFWFTHAVIRDELAHRLPVSARARARQRAVAWEQSRAALDPAASARAAEHILLSGGSESPSDGGHVGILVAGSEWAFGAGAWAAAARYAEAAIDAARRTGADPATMADLELRAAEAHFFNHDIGATRRRAAALTASDLTSLDDATRGRIVRLAVRTEMMASAQMGVGAIDVSALVDFVAATPDDRERAQALHLLSECDLAANRLDEAVAHAREGLTHAQRSGDHRTIGMAYAGVGFAHLTRTDLGRAEDAYQRMHRSAAAAGDGWLLSESLARLPYISLVTGDLDETEQRSIRAAEAAVEHRQYVSECLALCTRTSASLLRGDLAATDHHARRARAAMHRSGYLGALQHFYPAWLRSYLLTDDLAGAEALLDLWRVDGGAEAQPARRYVELVSGPGGRDRRPGSIPSARIPTQFRVGYAALQVGLDLQVGDTANLVPLLELVEEGVDLGLVFAMNWPVCLFRVLGDGHAALGAPARAAGFYRLAVERCRRSRARSELALALGGLATIDDDRAVGGEERRQAASEAYQLASRLGLAGLAGHAALATRQAIDLEAQADDPDYRVVLVTDIVGSTPLSVEFGDRAYHDVVMHHHRLVRAALAEHGGVEFSEGGDSLFAWFVDRARAVACASDVQARMAAARLAGTGCHVRIGLAGGVPFVDDGRPYGAVVNLAARICSAAGSDQVLVSEPLAAAAPGGLVTRSIGPVELKGFPGQRPLFAVV